MKNDIITQEILDSLIEWEDDLIYYEDRHDNGFNIPDFNPDEVILRIESYKHLLPNGVYHFNDCVYRDGKLELRDYAAEDEQVMAVVNANLAKKHNERP